MLECKFDSPKVIYPFSNNVETYTNSPSPSLINSFLKTASEKICGSCKNTGIDLKQCAKCKRVNYCGIDCQKVAWKAHQIVCENAFFIPKDEQFVCKLQEQDGKIRDLTQKAFKEITKATFVYHPLFSTTTRDVARTYSKGLKTGAKIETLDKIALTLSKKSSDLNIIALDDIQKGKFVCRFGGQVIHEKKWEASLNFSHKAKMYSTAERKLVFDASHYTSLGALINDGPPNCELTTDYATKTYEKGPDIPIEKVIIAIKNIKKGSALYIDNGIFHPVKRGTYQLDERTLSELYQNYGSMLNMSSIGETGWVFDVIKKNEKYNPQKLKSAEVQYILSTPYALAMLHLNTNLNPLKTLDNLNEVKPKLLPLLNNETEETKEKILLVLDQAEEILIFLSKISKSDKERFSHLVEQYSQHSFTHLCDALKKTTQLPTFEDCERFCRAFDKMKTLFVGTLAGCYWNCSEKTSFEELFFSVDHQKKLFDLSGIQDLDLILKQEIYQSFLNFFDLVYSKLSLKNQTLLIENREKFLTFEKDIENSTFLNF